MRAVLPVGSCLLGMGLVGHLVWVCWGPVDPLSPLMFWLGYWGAYRDAGVGACAAGLRLLRLLLDFLLGGCGKIQMTQVIRLAIYQQKVGNADAKCHEIQFSNRCILLVFFFIICKYAFSKLDHCVNVVFVVQRAHLGLSL